MPHCTRLVTVTVVTALLIAISAGSATASRGLGVAPTELTATARRLTFADGSGTFRSVCEWRLTISLHRTIAKSRDALMGQVTAAEVSNCSGGNFRVLAGTLPWHVTYASFRGILPSSVTGLALVVNGFSWLQEVFFGNARCLYAGNLRGIAEGRENRLTRITAERNDVIQLFSEALSAIACPEGGRYEGAFTLSTTLTLTLI